eukprot:TRINITY_DN312_c0_g1_i1.p1 TRINITY_DN312_c0_g1~~TRINITY_DN312_c0_g1_i1.p1  ORF type:complete len:262 (-),score=64.93 TRINITY_DN312_c0_g1_i1:60-845(-)
MASAPRCPRCNDRVYHAEEVLAIGQSWHQKCFSCKTCKRKLDSGNLCDKDGEIYCKACYGRAFGPKGYGFGGGAGSLATFGADTIVPVAGDAAPAAVPTKWCATCQKAADGKFCGDCGEKLEEARSELVEAKLEDVDSNRSRFEQIAAEAEAEAAVPTRPTKGSVAKQTLPPALAPKGKFGGGQKCVRCNKTVYDAERSNGPAGAYHNACFTCISCNKTLTSITLADRDGEIYCKACYGREFGPKGYGFGQGAGALANTGQ